MFRRLQVLLLAMAVCSTVGVFRVQRVTPSVKSLSGLEPVEIARRAVSCETGCDFNHDGRPDALGLVGLKEALTLRVTLTGVGTRDLTSPGTGFSGSGRFSAIDLNGDDHLDVVWQSSSRTAAPIVWLGDGKGGFVRMSAAELPETDFATIPTLPGGTPFRPSGGGTLLVTAASAKRHNRQVRPSVTPHGRARMLSFTLSAGNEGPRIVGRETARWLARTIHPPPVAFFFS